MKIVKVLICGLLLTAFLFFSLGRAFGQLFINEFMASNTGIVSDPDYGESADWIEIYNGSQQTVNLQGYSLTDNISDLYKWTFTGRVNLLPGACLLIWADGMNTGLHTGFKLSADGEELALVSPTGEIVDSLSFSFQEANISMGRKTDGASEWVFFTEPTPGRQNGGEAFAGIVKSEPTFSRLGGIFAAPLSLSIRSLYGGIVRYTLDGTEPSETAPVASSNLTINKTTVVRARIYKEGELPGPVVTHTYFIDPAHELGTLPVICLTSDPENFWDEEKGIYVQDFKPEWEIPVNIELFENDGSDRAAFNLRAGVKVNGLYSWKLPQKMLGVYFRKEYGAGKLDYPLIFEKERNSFDTFALRASGSDWTYTLFRDGLAQNATYTNTHIDNSGFRACVVYVNGEYLGIHNIREKIEEDYIVQNHGIDEGSVFMVENEDYAEAGGTAALDAYNWFHGLVHKDLSIPENWAVVSDEMDIENFTDLIATEVWSGNTSISHNVMAWRPKDIGKWRWILMDLDRGFFNVREHPISYYINQDSWPFRELMKNESYQHQFGKRLADHLFTTFHPGRINPLIDRHRDWIRDEIPRHVERWAGTTAIDNYGRPLESYEYWHDEVEDLRSFVAERPSYLLDDLTRYGFGEPEPLVIASFPDDAGTITLNGLQIPIPVCAGAYPAGESIRLNASAKAGFRFLGWKNTVTSYLVEKESIWKYHDKGTNLGTAWKETGYNDASWTSGKAELGYGDDDEATVLDYGGNQREKHPTTYFRKSFSIDNPERFSGLTLNLKCDDGAIVYLNGAEIIRYNMPAGTISYAQTASTAVNGSDESDFHYYPVESRFLKTGENILAAEVHQVSATSSDLSFDLELTALAIPGEGSYLSLQREIEVTVDGETHLSAVYESDGSCVVPAEIDTEVTLTRACSPWLISGDVSIRPGGKLRVEAGVEIHLSEGSSILAEGPIIAPGTSENPIIFRGNPELGSPAWGIIRFRNVRDTSYFQNVIIEDASHGAHPVYDCAALSAFNSVLSMDHLRIENVHGNPVAGRYSDLRLTNSYFHSSITGDLINVKYGKGYIENVDFTGNDQPDTDAIDYDDVVNGIIRNCRIHDFHGFNSDAIDIGEKAQNILIDQVFVYNVTDKGISVGQQSTANIQNSIFSNCHLGLGIKDSSDVTINHCTFYGNNIAIAGFEKNAGDAGGNARVQNSILSNCYESTVWNDGRATLDIRYSSSDNDTLPDGRNNRFVNPKFTHPTAFNFSLLPGSPCIAAASEGNMGAALPPVDAAPNLVLTEIAYRTDETIDLPEFFAILNPGSKTINLAGYRITQGVTFTFPEHAALGPGQKAYITGNPMHPFWENRTRNLYAWESGRLADEGENIRLETASGIVLDGVTYDNKAPWPELSHAEQAIKLVSPTLDNHFGENWIMVPVDEMVSFREYLGESSKLKVYPNPTAQMLFVEGIGKEPIQIYDLYGHCVFTLFVDDRSSVSINLSSLKKGLYLVRSGNRYARFVLAP